MDADRRGLRQGGELDAIVDLNAMKQPTILVTSPELEFILRPLADRYHVVKAWDRPRDDELSSVRVVVCIGNRPLGSILDRVPSIGLVACFTTGYEGLELEVLRKRGIVASHADGVGGETVAEFAIALILTSCRNIVAGDQTVRAGTWRYGPPRIGSSVSGLKLGIVGMGLIGKALAPKAEALGMKVSWWGPRPKPDIPWRRYDELITLASECDVLTVCARAEDSNRGLISAAIIDALGPEGLLVNVSRGQLVDEKALRLALCTGRLGAAALDVFEHEPTAPELWCDVPNAVLTPHIAGTTREQVSQMTASLIENIDRFFAGLPLATPIRC